MVLLDYTLRYAFLTCSPVSNSELLPLSTTLPRLLDQLEELMKRVGEALRNEVPSVQLYTVDLIMDVQHLRSLIKVVDIPAAYLLLRNLLENFTKLFVYLKAGKSINPDITLYFMFLYEYEANRLGRAYSLNKFKKDWTKKFLKILSTTPHDKALDLLRFIERLKEKQTPTLGVNPQVLEEFSENYGLKEASLDKLYSACSYVIHNQPPLPFFSLLEVKFFKNFLAKYLNSLRIVAEKLIGENVEVKEAHKSAPPKVKECLEATHSLWIERDLDIKNVIEKWLKKVEKPWVRPLTLAAIFYLISPPFKKLRKFLFTREDLEDVVEKLQPISFRIGLNYEVYETLNALQEALLQELEKYEEFSSLRSEEQKRTTAFYLLLLYLPRVLEEIVYG